MNLVTGPALHSSIQTQKIISRNLLFAKQALGGVETKFDLLTAIGIHNSICNTSWLAEFGGKASKLDIWFNRRVICGKLSS